MEPLCWEPSVHYLVNLPTSKGQNCTHFTDGATEAQRLSWAQNLGSTFRSPCSSFLSLGAAACLGILKADEL